MSILTIYINIFLNLFSLIAQSNSASSSPLHMTKRIESPLTTIGAKAFNDVLQMLEEERVSLESQLEQTKQVCRILYSLFLNL